MMPGYSLFTKAIALKCVLRPADIPSVQLGVNPFETLESISHGRPVLTQPLQREYSNPTVGGLEDQSYFGVSGFGALIPNVPPGEIPYYGPMTGGD